MNGALIEFSPAKGGIADPKRQLDLLLQDRQITRREYEAGRFYGDVFEHAVSEFEYVPVLAHLDQAFDRQEIDTPALVRCVVLDHKRPTTAAGMQRLRTALSYLAMHIEQTEIGVAGLARPTDRAVEPHRRASGD